MKVIAVIQWTEDVLRNVGVDLERALWSWQGLATLAILALAAYGTRAVDARARGNAAGGKPGGSALWGALARRVAPAAILSGLALLAWAACGVMGEPALVFQALFVLGALMVLIRTAVHLMMRTLSPLPYLSRLERVLGWALWMLVILLLLRWLEPVAGVLRAISIPFGGRIVSLLDVIRAVVVLVLFIGGATYLGAVMERRVLGVSALPIGVRVGVAKVSRVLLIVVAVVLGLTTLGVDLTALTVIGGAVGVGIGFGLQRIASNFVSGFVLLGDRSIRPGDVITIGSRFGVVRELRARYVVVRDRDGVDTLIPNENIITSEVINWSYADRHIRLKVPVQISYEDNPRNVISLMEEAARSHPRVEREPAPAARVMGFGENGIELELRFWIQDPEDGVNNVRSDIFLAMWDAFKAAGVTIPYPQRDIRIRGQAGPTQGAE